jgi:hypothetical protein
MWTHTINTAHGRTTSCECKWITLSVQGQNSPKTLLHILYGKSGTPIGLWRKNGEIVERSVPRSGAEKQTLSHILDFPEIFGKFSRDWVVVRVRNRGRVVRGSG